MKLISKLRRRFEKLNEPQFSIPLDPVGIALEHGFDNWGHIASLRFERGLTQKELAKTSGLSASYISKIENGKYLWLSTETFEKLAFALGVKATDLVKEIAPPREKWYSYLAIKELGRRQSS